MPPLGRPLYEQTSDTRIAGLRRDVGRLMRRGAGRWQIVGDPAFCDFVTGTNAAASAEIPNPVPLRIRWLQGGGLEIQGDVTDLSPGDTICVFPTGYQPDYDTPVPGHDDQGNYVPCRLYSDGTFVYGVT